MKKLVLIFLISFCLLFTGCASEMDKLAQCLDKKGAVMYGADWCGACQNQKKIFAQSFDYINYVNCDFHAEQCKALGISVYPVWIINGQLISGVQTIAKLKEYSACDLKP